MKLYANVFSVANTGWAVRAGTIGKGEGRGGVDRSSVAYRAFLSEFGDFRFGRLGISRDIIEEICRESRRAANEGDFNRGGSDGFSIIILCPVLIGELFDKVAKMLYGSDGERGQCGGRRRGVQQLKVGWGGAKGVFWGDEKGPVPQRGFWEDRRSKKIWRLRFRLVGGRFLFDSYYFVRSEIAVKQAEEFELVLWQSCWS